MARDQCSENRVIVLDLDGTLIPHLVDWEELRGRVAEMLGVPAEKLRPLGEVVLSMSLNKHDLRQVMEIVEEYEERSLQGITEKLGKPRRRLLSRLRALGYKVIVVSMRSSSTLIGALRRLGVDDLVDQALSRDDAPSRMAQLRTISSMFPCSCIVFIGDSTGDLEAGRRIGIPTIIVGSSERLGEAVERALHICGGSSQEP